jgi:sulfite exporter TauE/SafE
LFAARFLTCFKFRFVSSPLIGVALLGALLGEPATSAGAQAAEYVAAGVLCLASGLALAASKDWRLTPLAVSDRSKPANCGTHAP